MSHQPFDPFAPFQEGAEGGQGTVERSQPGGRAYPVLYRLPIRSTQSCTAHEVTRALNVAFEQGALLVLDQLPAPVAAEAAVRAVATQRGWSTDRDVVAVVAALLRDRVPNLGPRSLLVAAEDLTDEDFALAAATVT